MNATRVSLLGGTIKISLWIIVRCFGTYSLKPDRLPLVLPNFKTVVFMRVAQLLVGILIAGSLASCKSDSNPTEPPPTDKTITVDVTYVSHSIENSTSFATWPVAVFPFDAQADSFKVHVYGYNGTFSRSPYTIKWKAGEQPPTDYDIYPSTKDIKDGKQYFVIGRTWCSGCTAPDPEWVVNYRKGYGTPKADVTYIYN